MKLYGYIYHQIAKTERSSRYLSPSGKRETPRGDETKSLRVFPFTGLVRVCMLLLRDAINPSVGASLQPSRLQIAVQRAYTPSTIENAED